MQNKIISAPKPKQGVSAEEWSVIFADYSKSVSRYIANLAAHDWYIVLVDGKIGYLVPWGSIAQGWWVNGESINDHIDMTQEEIDGFFPVASKGNIVNDLSFTYTYNWKSDVTRSTILVMPEDK